MWRLKLGIALLLTLLVSTAMYAVALAWPDQPPVKAYISGPGIEGQLQITDSDVLETLRLGELEDLGWGLVNKPPLSGDGFKIIRYFDDGSFRFADLTYYANPKGLRSYVYWEDGPMLQGSHTPYNRQWLYTNEKGNAALIAYLQKIGARVDSAVDSAHSISATLDPLPETIKVGETVRLGFTLSELASAVMVWIGRAGEEQKTAIPAKSEGSESHFVTSFAFPQAGAWNWALRIDNQKIEVPMPPLQVDDSQTVQNSPVAEPNVSTKDAKAAVTNGNNAAPGALANEASNSDSLLDILTIAAGVIGLIGVAGALWFRARQSRV